MLDMKNNSTACDPSIHNITNFLASSVHDMKNSVNMLIYSLEKVLASVETTQLSAHTELMQVSHEAKRIKALLNYYSYFIFFLYFKDLCTTE